MSTPDTSSPVDVLIGAGARGARLLRGVARAATTLVGPSARAVASPPWVPERLQAAWWRAELGREGAALRAAAEEELSRRVDVLLPVVLAEVLRRVPLAELLARYVDLDAVVAAVDLDRAAARLDVDAVVGRADLDAVLGRVDVDAVAERVHLDPILDRLDLTAVVLERVDLDRVLTAVLSRLDLVALAEEVVDGVDLPAIIRESTGSMASDTVREVRMQGIAADEVVGRAVDRILLRRRRGGAVPAPPSGPGPEHVEPESPDQLPLERPGRGH